MKVNLYILTDGPLSEPSLFRDSADGQVGSGSRSSGQVGQGGEGEAGWSACLTTTNHDRLTPQVMATDCHAKSGGRCTRDVYPLSL